MSHRRGRETTAAVMGSRYFGDVACKALWCSAMEKGQRLAAANGACDQGIQRGECYATSAFRLACVAHIWVWIAWTGPIFRVQR